MEPAAPSFDDILAAAAPLEERVRPIEGPLVIALSGGNVDADSPAFRTAGEPAPG